MLKIFALAKNKNFLRIFAFLFLAVIVGILFFKAENNQAEKNNTFDLNRPFVKGEKQSSKKIKVKNFSIIIPAINIKAPIIPNVSNVKKDYLKALERGVVHYKGASLPGQGGNIVIFGHSAYYWNRPGNYKEIFRHLEDSKIGDIIQINFNDKKYLYQIKKMVVVDPNEVKYLRQTKKERLTLITCVPPGTTKNRLIVMAEPKRD